MSEHSQHFRLPAQHSAHLLATSPSALEYLSTDHAQDALGATPPPPPTKRLRAEPVDLTGAALQPPCHSFSCSCARRALGPAAPACCLGSGRSAGDCTPWDLAGLFESRHAQPLWSLVLPAACLGAAGDDGPGLADEFDEQLAQAIAASLQDQQAPGQQQLQSEQRGGPQLSPLPPAGASGRSHGSSGSGAACMGMGMQFSGGSTPGAPASTAKNPSAAAAAGGAARGAPAASPLPFAEQFRGFAVPSPGVGICAGRKEPMPFDAWCHQQQVEAAAAGQRPPTPRPAAPAGAPTSAEDEEAMLARAIEASMADLQQQEAAAVEAATAAAAEEATASAAGAGEAAAAAAAGGGEAPAAASGCGEGGAAASPGGGAAASPGTAAAAAVGGGGGDDEVALEAEAPPPGRSASPQQASWELVPLVSGPWG